jgi:hypothetical protein
MFADSYGIIKQVQATHKCLLDFQLPVFLLSVQTNRQGLQCWTLNGSVLRCVDSCRFIHHSFTGQAFATDADVLLLVASYVST